MLWQQRSNRINQLAREKNGYKKLLAFFFLVRAWLGRMWNKMFHLDVIREVQGTTALQLIAEHIGFLSKRFLPLSLTNGPFLIWSFEKVLLGAVPSPRRLLLQTKLHRSKNFFVFYKLDSRTILTWWNSPNVVMSSLQGIFHVKNLAGALAWPPSTKNQIKPPSGSTQN